MRYDFCVVGGGIVGLAVAREILHRRPGAALVLLEKEDQVARHQTGHNSGVVHAGVYYPPGSLKARLCRAGNEMTRAFCAEHRIPLEVCGKLIVATTTLEAARLEDLRERCRINQIPVETLGAAGLRDLEPRIAGIAALRVPSTGIVDYRRISLALAVEVHRLGGQVLLSSPARRMRERAEEVEVEIRGSDPIRAARLVACAGLQSDRLARAAGLPVRHVVVPFRGEYFRLPEAKSSIVKHLIYPVPDPELPFLGCTSRA